MPLLHFQHQPKVPCGIESIEKVLNCEIGFRDLEKALNLSKMYVKYRQNMEIPNSAICFIQISFFTADDYFANVFFQCVP